MFRGIEVDVIHRISRASMKLKDKFYRTDVRPAVSYWAEWWTFKQIRNMGFI